MEEKKKPEYLAHSTEFSGTYKDPRDGKVYKTIKIGGQTWLAENLVFDAKGSRCYDDDPANGKKYGRLYDWETAKNACPPGWHLPSGKEWHELAELAGGWEEAGNELKAKNGWNEYEGNSGSGADTYDFSALPGGICNSKSKFAGIGEFGLWWSADDKDMFGKLLGDGSKAEFFYMTFSSENAHYSDDDECYDKRELLGVRCIQDPHAGTCPKCYGTGKIRHAFLGIMQERTCPDCNGTGNIKD